MSTLSKLMGFVVFTLSLATLVMGVFLNSYIIPTSPRQRDIASGHILPKMIVYSNMGLNHVEYLTQFEEKLFGLSYALGAMGLIGLFCYLFAAGKLRKPTSFG